MTEKKDTLEFSVSADDYQAMLDNLPRLVMLIDLEGTIVYWNNGGEKIFGYTAEECLGNKVWFLYPNRDRDDFTEELEILEGGGMVAAEMEGRQKDGSTVWADVKRELIEMKNGKMLILASASDISIQIKAEQDFAANERRLESILETAVEGIVTIDREGVIQSFNSAAEEIFGYEDEEVIGENVSILMPKPYRDEHDEYIHDYLRTGERKIIGIGREVRGRKKDGTVFPMDLSVSEVKLEDKIIFTGFIRDISERRRLENRLLRISEEERRKIGRDLHDGLGQMLTGIGLISQNLARKLKVNGLPGADEVAEIYKMIREADEQAKALAHGLVNIELESEGFSEAVRHLCDRAKKMFKIDCRCDFDDKIEIENDMTKLHLYRIIQEAVSNAVKHGEATKVEVGIHREKNYVRITVTDNGVGFKGSKKRDKIKGIGMNTMNYRAHILGGNLNVEESEEGNTMIVCTIPNIKSKEKEKP